MGLGSQNDHTRNEFKGIAGKRDWKADVTCVADAQKYCDEVAAILGKDPNGKYLSAAYMDIKLNLLKRYIETGEGLTLKEWESGQKK